MAERKKRCPTCGKEKAVSRFSKNKSKRDGLSTECKICTRDAARKRRANARPKPRPALAANSKIEQKITFNDPRTGQEKEIDVAESILMAIRVGTPFKYAAQQAGVDVSTAKRWVARGREWTAAGKEPEDAPEAERPYALFATGVERARGAAVAFYVAQLYKAANSGSFRAAIEWLRAQAPDEFKQRLGIDLGDDRRAPALEPETQDEFHEAFVAAYRGELPELKPEDFLPIEAPPAEDDGGEG